MTDALSQIIALMTLRFDVKTTFTKMLEMRGSLTSILSSCKNIQQICSYDDNKLISLPNLFGSTPVIICSGSLWMIYVCHYLCYVSKFLKVVQAWTFWTCFLAIVSFSVPVLLNHSKGRRVRRDSHTSRAVWITSSDQRPQIALEIYKEILQRPEQS